MVRPVVLLYHRVCADEDWRPSEFVVPASVFRAQMRYLARGPHRACRLSDVLAGHTPGDAPARPVAITFDDGYADVRTHAAPILRELGLHAAVFPVLGAGPRGSAAWGAPPALQVPLLTADDLRALEADGFEVGSHTLTHPVLTRCSDRDLERELAGSREVLARIAARPLPVIAYPFGAVDERVKRAARRAGFTAGLAVGTGPLSLHADVLEIRRQQMETSADERYLRVRLSGARALLAWYRWKVAGALRTLGSLRAGAP